jgi:hypothetical protein
MRYVLDTQTKSRRARFPVHITPPAIERPTDALSSSLSPNAMALEACATTSRLAPTGRSSSPV